MKTVIVLSDTHGNISAMEKLLPIMSESDYVFHLGDYDRDVFAFKRELGDKIYSVKGNCDGGGEEIIVEIDGVKVMLTHGDRYGVKTSLYKLLLKAKELGVNAVFYGHTHEPRIDEIDSVTLINPGCATRYGEKTYCFVAIYDGKLTAKIVPFI